MAHREIIISGRDASVIMKEVLDELNIGNIDILLRQHTAFFSVGELFDTADDYFPMLFIDSRERKLLADFYDRFQERMGDTRKVYRIERWTGKV